MSTKTQSLAIPAAERVFLLRRLHSLTGVIPIGAFLLFHFFENSSARLGAEAFNHTVEEIGKMPYIYVLEVLTLILPILFHSIYGLFITSSAKPNLATNGFLRNWLYFFQRMTGLIAFAYIGFHIWTTRVWALFIKGDHITYADMHSMLLNPYVFAFYILGIVSITFHFANGLWSFSITWGLVRSKIGQERLTILTLLLFLILCVWGLDIVSAFRFNKSILMRIGI